jgi:hypothetical protein
VQYVSSTPATRLDVINLQEQLDQRLTTRQARETGICPVREELYAQCFDELIRQVTINCAERGLLLLRVRDEIRMTIAAYQTLYESSIAFGMRKALQAEQGKADMEARIKQLEAEKKDLERQVQELKAKAEAIEKVRGSAPHGRIGEGSAQQGAKAARPAQRTVGHGGTRGPSCAAHGSAQRAKRCRASATGRLSPLLCGCARPRLAGGRSARCGTYSQHTALARGLQPLLPVLETAL